MFLVLFKDSITSLSYKGHESKKFVHIPFESYKLLCLKQKL